MTVYDVSGMLLCSAVHNLTSDESPVELTLCLLGY